MKRRKFLFYPLVLFLTRTKIENMRQPIKNCPDSGKTIISEKKNQKLIHRVGSVYSNLVFSTCKNFEYKKNHNLPTSAPHSVKNRLWSSTCVCAGKFVQNGTQAYYTRPRPAYTIYCRKAGADWNGRLSSA